LTLLAVTAILTACGQPSSKKAGGFRLVVVDEQGPVDPWGKTTGDLNLDGRPDLVVGGHASQDLVWYRNPDWERMPIASGHPFSTDHAVADIDGDGVPDVVSLTSDVVVWYRGPDWTEAPIDRNKLHDIEVVDLDGDGDLDLLGRNQSAFTGHGDKLFVYLQEEGGVWTREEVETVDGEGLAISDIDDDGFPDAVLNGTYYLNPGRGDERAWTEVRFSDSWEWPHVYADVADMNGDGREDIVHTPAELEGQSYRISWFERPAVLGQPWPEHVIDPQVEAVHHFVGASDFDRDGDVDVASAEMHQGQDPDEVKVYLNDGTGLGWTKQVISTRGSHSMQVVDLDRDGDDDLVGANWSGEYQAVEIYENTACEPSWNTWKRHVIDDARPWTAIFVTSADVDADGLPDVLAGGWWYRNPGQAGGGWARHAFGGDAANLAAVFDVDSDGAIDVVATGWKGDGPGADLVWCENQGDGTFRVHDNLQAGPGDFLQGVAVGHFSVTDPGAAQIALSWHGAGAGIQLLTVPERPEQTAWSMQTISDFSQDEALSTADIDGDGDTDLVLGTSWLRNEGDGWSRHDMCRDCPAPDRNVVVDVDGDGRLDVVVGFESISKPGPLSWFQSTEDPTAPWIEHRIAEPVGPMSVGAGDVDLDGDIDIVVGEHDLEHPETARLLVYENVEGDGRVWNEHVAYTGDEHHDGAHLFDFDLDGDLDVVSVGWGHDRVLLYENRWVQCHDRAVPTP
jgi:hypothetical protein